MLTDNAENVNGSDIYMHDIFYYADEYILNELNINPSEMSEDDKNEVNKNFEDMIDYIHDHIKRVDLNDVDTLNNIFSIYKKLCKKYYIIPQLEEFGDLIGVCAQTISRWAAGERRASSNHGEAVKKWKMDCGAALKRHLQRHPGTNANLIFVAKADYGMVETAPMQLINAAQQISAEQLEEIQSRHQEALEAGPPDEWED